MKQEEKRNYLDDYFRDKLNDFESPAPEDMWMKIDRRMKRKKLITLWTVTGSLAASIVILISVGVGYYFGSRHSIKSGNSYSVITSKNIENSKQTLKSKNEVVSARKNNSLGDPNKKLTTNNSKNEIDNNNQLDYNNYGTIKNSKSEIVSANNIPARKSFKQTTSLKKIDPRQAHISNKTEISKPIASYKDVDLLPLSDELKGSGPIKTASKKTWSFGGNAGPFYSAWNVGKGKQLYPNDYVNSIEEPVIAFSGGLNINVETSRWRFETGVYYSRSDQNLDEVSKNLVVINNNDLVMASSPNSQYGFQTSTSITNDAFIGRIWKVETSPGISKNIVGDTRNPFEYYSVYYGSNNTSYSIVNAFGNASENNASNSIKSMVQQNNYIQFPVIAGYKIIDRKIDLVISGGMCTNILISSKAYLKLNNDVISLGSSQTIRTFDYSGILGLAFEVPIARKISFRLEPRLSYSISSIDKNSDINIRPYSIGAFSGASLRF